MFVGRLVDGLWGRLDSVMVEREVVWAVERMMEGRRGRFKGG